jgi:AcrR family transcriptional regulator
MLKGARTRRRILESAANAFRVHGYAGTSLKNIADAADLQVASLYFHFPSKEALVDEVLNIGLDSIETATRDAVLSMGSNATALTRLRAAIAAHVRTNLEAGAFASANLRILGQVPKEVRERHIKRQRNYAQFWEQLLADGRTSGELRSDLDPDAVRLLLLGSMNWAVEWYRSERFSIAQIAATCSEMALNGLQNHKNQILRETGPKTVDPTPDKKIKSKVLTGR